MCSHPDCIVDKCSGACGDSFTNTLKFGSSREKNIYYPAKKYVIEAYFNTVDILKVSTDNKKRLYDPLNFKSLFYYDDLEEALEKLNRLKNVTKKLQKYKKL